MRVVLIYKRNSKTEMRKYRLVYLLHNSAKIFERTVKNQLFNLVEIDHNILLTKVFKLGVQGAC